MLYKNLITLCLVLFLSSCLPIVNVKEILSNKFCPSDQLIRIRLTNSESQKDWETTKKWAKEKCAEVGITKEVKDEDYEDVLTSLKQYYGANF